MRMSRFEQRVAQGFGRAFETARREVRHAWRAVRRIPGLALVVVLSLGVGVGVNTAVFSWLEAVVLRPLPGVRGGADFGVAPLKRTPR
ncbi:hypothetical protein tb265_48460 [Gemmatimonadetes bacterium T265]|nr:hypothetical protein tb265_48460 [Gemmatimonadetes bacterium T265]